MRIRPSPARRASLCPWHLVRYHVGMDFRVEWTGVPGAFDASLYLVDPNGPEDGDLCVATVGGLASVEEVHAWAVQQGAAYKQEHEPPEPVSDSHVFTV